MIIERFIRKMAVLIVFSMLSSGAFAEWSMLFTTTEAKALPGNEHEKCFVYPPFKILKNQSIFDLSNKHQLILDDFVIKERQGFVIMEGRGRHVTNQIRKSFVIFTMGKIKGETKWLGMTSSEECAFRFIVEETAGADGKYIEDHAAHKKLHK